MLEHSLLLIGSWARTVQADGKLAWTRSISDGRGQALGFVHLASDARSTWLSWLRRRRLEVYETPDASFLMSLTRSWGVARAWQIDDAEDRHVGGVYTKTIVTSENEWIGFLEADVAGGAGRIVDADKRALARFAATNDGHVELAFAPECTANPFTRMLLLGAVLTLDAAPRDGG